MRLPDSLFCLPDRIIYRERRFPEQTLANGAARLRIVLAQKVRSVCELVDHRSCGGMCREGSKRYRMSVSSIPEKPSGSDKIWRPDEVNLEMLTQKATVPPGFKTRASSGQERSDWNQ